MNRIRQILGSGSLKVSSTTNLVTYAATVLLSLSAYRLMISFTSIAIVGCWALVQGLAAVSRIADLGLGTNLTRFVASLEHRSQSTLSSILKSAALMSFLPVTILAAALSPGIYIFTIHRSGLAITHGELAWLIVLSLGGTILSTVCALVASILEGFGRVMTASGSTTLYNLVTLLAVVPSIRMFGAVGIGIANFVGLGIQATLLTILLIGRFRTLPRSAEKDFGVRDLFLMLRKTTMQNFGVVLARMALDPLTRLLVARSAPLDVMAYFELAFRVTTQVRSALQSAVQPLLFLGASNIANAGERFRTPQRVIVYLAAIGMIGFITGAPIISYLLLGHVVERFLTYVLILGIGSMCGLVGVPGYFLDAANGRFGELFKMTMMMVVINVTLGIPLSLLIGPAGAITAYSIAMAACGYVQLRTCVSAGNDPIGRYLLIIAGSIVASIATYFVFQSLAHYRMFASVVSFLQLSASLSLVLGVCLLWAARSVVRWPVRRKQS